MSDKEEDQSMIGVDLQGDKVIVSITHRDGSVETEELRPDSYQTKDDASALTQQHVRGKSKDARIKLSCELEALLLESLTQGHHFSATKVRMVLADVCNLAGLKHLAEKL